MREGVKQPQNFVSAQGRVVWQQDVIQGRDITWLQ